MWIFEPYDILYYLHNDIINIYIKDKDSNPESKPELETDEAEDIVDNKEQTYDIKNSKIIRLSIVYSDFAI